ncbi:MAG TPA: cation transporter [Caldilineaceae bacterium]|nr:cation transporter [Caldilineaceae bacterium]
MLHVQDLNHDKHARCQAMPAAKPASAEQLAQAETVFLLVQGMGCPACALRVRNGLLQIEGVVAADVVLSHGLAKVWYDPAVLQPETLAARLPALADDGRHHYSASPLVFSSERVGGNDA